MLGGSDKSSSQKQSDSGGESRDCKKIAMKIHDHKNPKSAGATASSVQGDTTAKEDDESSGSNISEDENHSPPRRLNS